MVKDLTDDGQAGSIDETVVSALIEITQGIVDAYISQGGYSVPLSTVPVVVKDNFIAIVIYKLYRRRTGEVVVSVDDDKRAAYKWLEGIASGRLTLPISKAIAGDVALGVVSTSFKPEIA